MQLTGSLNAKPFRARLSGGPLINLTPDKPYNLEAHLTASDVRLNAKMSFPKPLDLTTQEEEIMRIKTHSQGPWMLILALPLLLASSAAVGGLSGVEIRLTNDGIDDIAVTVSAAATKIRPV